MEISARRVGSLQVRQVNVSLKADMQDSREVLDCCDEFLEACPRSVYTQKILEEVPAMLYNSACMTKEDFMREALRQATKAKDIDEVPIGAVIVRNGEIISVGHNLTETTKDPTAHAEMNAIRQAACALGGWRLSGCEMYVTCEPCAMCAGALIWSRIEKLHIGTMDPKAGACGSVMNILRLPELNHTVEVESGILEKECSLILKDFFSNLRKRTGEKSGRPLRENGESPRR